MRFMVLVKADKNSEAGVLLAGEGLQPSSKGARVRFSGENAEERLAGQIAANRR